VDVVVKNTSWATATVAATAQKQRSDTQLGTYSTESMSHQQEQQQGRQTSLWFSLNVKHNTKFEWICRL
jgi:hypothetical protein